MSLSTPSAPTLPSTDKTPSQPATTSLAASSSIPIVKDGPPNITATLAQLKHEKKNTNLARLPPTHTITRRPILHGPIASPFAGPSAQKVVYVSHSTPLMSAVKRVRKFLSQIEKRATQDVKLLERGEARGRRKLMEASDTISRDKEEVLVKASGRAMGKAVAVGKWFEEKEREWRVRVEVRAGSVSVVDDVVEVEQRSDGGDGDVEAEGKKGEKDTEDNSIEASGEETRLECGDTTMELFGGFGTKSSLEADGEEAADPGEVEQEIEGAQKPAAPTNTEDQSVATSKKKRRRRKKRKTYDAEDDVPEQRLRWIKTVEVAISLKA